MDNTLSCNRMHEWRKVHAIIVVSDKGTASLFLSVQKFDTKWPAHRAHMHAWLQGAWAYKHVAIELTNSEFLGLSFGYRPRKSQSDANNRPLFSFSKTFKFSKFQIAAHLMVARVQVVAALLQQLQPPQQRVLRQHLRQLAEIRRQVLQPLHQRLHACAPCMSTPTPMHVLRARRQQVEYRFHMLMNRDCIMCFGVSYRTKRFHLHTCTVYVL